MQLVLVVCLSASIDSIYARDHSRPLSDPYASGSSALLHDNSHMIIHVLVNVP